MKATITGYFDLDGKATFEEQVDTAERHGLTYLCLRSYDHQPLIELNDSEHKKILSLLKDKKMKIAAIDTAIPSYDLNSDSKHTEALDAFKYMLKLADKFKVNTLFFRLPVFHDVIEEFENIKTRLEPFVDAAMRSGKKIILLPVNHYKANVYAFILKKMKSNVLSVYFDPVELMMNNESTTTAYRLLKKNIGAFAAIDADHQNVPHLMGYGKTDLLSIFKKMIRDRYDGLFMMDNRFNEEVFFLEKKKAGFFAKIMKRNQKKKESMLSDLSKKIFPNEQTKNVTIDDILDNQIKVLNVIFK